MSLEHNLPASGDMCVSVLSRLCTVMPNMYRVGISKVSPTHTQSLEGSGSGASEPTRGLRTVPKAVQWSWVNGMPTPLRTSLRPLPLPNVPSACFHLSKPNPSAALAVLSP